jgi:autoinducer 2-degrading protein
MIIRIVKMSFRHDAAEAFQAVFTEAQPKISGFPGCHGVILLRDILHPHIFFTYSTWNSHADLEIYRDSELFKSTWALAKALFNDKPEAWSVEKII